MDALGGGLPHHHDAASNQIHGSFASDPLPKGIPRYQPRYQDWSPPSGEALTPDDAHHQYPSYAGEEHEEAMLGSEKAVQQKVEVVPRKLVWWLIGAVTGSGAIAWYTLL